MWHLETLYNKLKKTKTKGQSKFHGVKGVPYEHLIEHIFERSVGLEVSRSQLNMAFMLCKMTVEAENEDGPKEYNQVKFVELLEFIGRVAYLQFKETVQHETLTLAQKILRVLRMIFKFIGEEPIDPQDMNNLESDSDDDY